MCLWKKAVLCYQMARKPLEYQSKMEQWPLLPPGNHPHCLWAGGYNAVSIANPWMKWKRLVSPWWSGSAGSTSSVTQAVEDKDVLLTGTTALLQSVGLASHEFMWVIGWTFAYWKCLRPEMFEILELLKSWNGYVGNIPSLKNLIVIWIGGIAPVCFMNLLFSNSGFRILTLFVIR